MKKVMTIGWLIVFSLILIMNIYIWNIYWQIPFEEARLLKVVIYLAVHLSLSLISGYYFYLFFSAKTDTVRARRLSYISGFYITFLHYSILLYVFHDLVYLSRHFINYSEGFKLEFNNLFFGGFLIFFIAGLISLLSIINSEKLRLRKYRLGLRKGASGLDSLSLVYISDGHLGTDVNERSLDRIVEKINSLEPDLLLLGGDFFDEGSSQDLKVLASRKLASIRTKYGIYAVEGNHEYKSGAGNIDEEMGQLSQEGIGVLQDDLVKIGGDFYILGRKDSQGARVPLEDLTSQLAEDLPVILLDHRPSFREAKENGRIDLQLSGHTHSGQFFPLQILDRFLPSLSGQYIYGHHSLGSMELIVSSGVGNWGLPIRVGSEREIVSIRIDFI